LSIASTGPDVIWRSRDALIAWLALAGILGHLSIRLVGRVSGPVAGLPLLLVLLVGGGPLVLRLVWRAVRGEFGSDQLAGISIVASVLLDSPAGAIVVLMPPAATSSASPSLRRPGASALADRVLTLPHRRRARVFDDVLVATFASATRCRSFPTKLSHDGDAIEGLPWTSRTDGWTVQIQGPGAAVRPARSTERCPHDSRRGAGRHSRYARRMR
jgi:hypothetical protein